MAKKKAAARTRGGGAKKQAAWTSALDLAARLAKGAPAACYLLEGGESFLVGQALTTLREALLGDNPGPALCELDGAKAALAAVLDELRTLPFLGTQARLVVVSDAGAGSGGGFAGMHGEALAAYLEAPNPTSTLVLVADKLDNRLRGVKALVGRAERVDCRPYDDAGLLAFVRARAEAWGRPFARGADRALLDRLGGQDVALAALDAEVGKLASAGGEGPIAAAEVEALASFGSSEQGFAIVDRVGRGDVQGALQTLQRVFRDGLITSGGGRTTDPTGIAMIVLPTLRWDLGRLIKGRAMLDRGVPTGQIVSELRIYYRDKATFRERLRRADRAELVRRHALLRRADGALRSSADPQGTLCDVVVALTLAERGAVGAR